MSIFKDKVLLITGGTGSFGNAVLNRFLRTDIGEIRIFSRDEKKQDDMRHDFQARMPEVANKIKFYIGDVRNKSTLKYAMKGVDYVFHAAALKQVPSCEFFPMEAVKTNVIGTDNTLDAAIDAGVKCVICLSTDKAAYPINAMGITKAIEEKIAVAKSRLSGDTKICCTRYGNVMCSYTMEVLGYANEQAATCNSMTEWVFTPDKVRETFAASQTVTIPNTTTPVDVSATLNRVVPRLEIITTDPVPEAVKGVRITYAAGGGGINPITGLSSTNAGYTYLIANPTTFEGISKLRSHLFIATDQQTMTVTLDALDADGNSVSHKVVPNVPFQRNKVTKLTGALYGADVTGNFTINTAWITDTNIVEF